MAGGPLHLAELRYPEADAARGTAVALLPVGAVEPHGPHAPLGTDTFISEAVCARAAARLRDQLSLQPLVLPTIAYGVTRFSRDFPGSIGVRDSTLHALVRDVCSDLEGRGIRHRFIVNSHFEPGHVAALRSAAADTGSVLFDLTRRRLAARLTDEFRSGAAHAGRYETSLMLALHADLVDTSRMATLRERFVDMPAEMAAGKDSFLALGMDQAYCGAPADATAAEGERTLATLVTLLVELVQEHIEA